MNSEVEASWERRAQTERRKLPFSLAALFDEAVAKFGDKPLWITVDGDGTTLTYREFSIQVERCAAALIARGIGAGSHVAIMLPNIPMTAILWTALSKIGAVAVGVNTSLTANEIDYVLSKSDPVALILDAKFLPLLAVIGFDKLPIDKNRIIVHGDPAGTPFGTLHDFLDSAGASVPTAVLDPQAPASILFTSGSSGFPKPSLLPQRWYTQMGWARGRQGPPVRRILIDGPFYYMAGQWRFATALYYGAAICVAEKPTLKQYLDRLLAYGIDLASASSLTAKLPDDERYSQLSLVWVTSSGLPKEMHADVEKRLRAPVREIYGSTELGSCIVMPTDIKSMVGSGSCGLPDAWRDCRIVDPDGKDVRQGEPGELLIRGPGMLLEYYNMKEASAEAFTGDWFRTGDLFVQDSQGFYYWKSRIKDIIRRSRQNISAHEVEAAVRLLPEVMEAIALAVPDEYREEEVKIYVELVPGLTKDDLPPERILSHCRNLLAAFKVPRYIEYMDKLPRTASNKISKVDVRKLKQDLRLGSYDAQEGIWC